MIPAERGTKTKGLLNMRTLEQTLIHSSELELQMLVSLMHDGEPSECASCYQRISALVIFAYIVDSGLSQEGEQALMRIETAANKLITALAPHESS